MTAGIACSAVSALPAGRFFAGSDDVYPRIVDPGGHRNRQRTLKFQIGVWLMFSALASALASISLSLKQPLTSYCDLETTHDDALISKRGDYCTWLRVDGMQRMAERKDYDAITEAMRLDLSGALENKGHAIAGWYISDPDAALVEIERVNLSSCRSIAREVGLDLHDILNERAVLWPKLMRWEAVYFQVWTRTSVLTKEERTEFKADTRQMPNRPGLSREPNVSICAAKLWRHVTPPSSRAFSPRCAP